MNQQAWNITVEQLSGGYGSRLVLKDFSAVIPGGAVTTILGESGCGKTTLLRLLLGLNRPFSGSIRIGGRNIVTMPEKQFRKM
ncbi:MAG: ATP-binding cassette domain-containing protein, partial [Mailhella sp.]